MNVFLVWSDEPWQDPHLEGVFKTKEDATAYIENQLKGKDFTTEDVAWTTFYIFGHGHRYWIGKRPVQSLQPKARNE